MAEGQDTVEQEAVGPSGAGWMTLFFLYLLNTLLVLDKVVLTVLLEPIKAEFAMSDLQLGLLTGSVYAICLGVASLPFGLLADRVNRRNLAAACVAIWSTMTALCGLAQNVAALIAARIGVGLGEAGGGPSAVSMISDMFPHKRRATAMAIFGLGTPTAGLINLTVNTQLAHEFGWRMPLFIAAGLGIALAAFMLIFAVEPARGAAEKKTAADRAPPLGETLAFIGRQKSLICLLSGAAVAYTVLAGVSAWNFSFLVRVHNAEMKDIGPMLGVAVAVAGILGIYATGRLADYLSKKDERWRVWVITLTTLLSVILGVATFTTDSLGAAIAFTGAFAGASTLWLAPTIGLTQGLVKVRMRGTVGAVVFLLGNLVGYGLGPPLVGWLSDALAAMGEAHPLRGAILLLVVCNVFAASLFALSGVWLRRDLKALA